MSIALATTPLTFAFSDGAGGHVCALGSAPAAGQFEILAINSDTTVQTPPGFTLTVSDVGNQGVYIFTRVTTGSEGDSITVTTNGSYNTAVQWSRWDGVSGVDLTPAPSVGSGDGTSSPAHSTGVMAETGELVFAFSANHSTNSGNQALDSWSAGFTPLTAVKEDTSWRGCWSLTGYKADAGTASESPSVSWTGDACGDRTMASITLTSSEAAPESAELAATMPLQTAVFAAAARPMLTLAATMPLPAATLAAQPRPLLALAVGMPAPAGALRAQPRPLPALAAGMPMLTARLSVLAAGAVTAGAAATALGQWFTQVVLIERLTGQGAYGPVLAAPVAEAAFVDHGQRKVLDPNGDAVTSSARVFLPATADPVPLGSRVTLPAELGSVKAFVLARAMHVSGMGTPDHQEVSLT